jgi:hypothetical protein
MSNHSYITTLKIIRNHKSKPNANKYILELCELFMATVNSEQHTYKTGISGYYWNEISCRSYVWLSVTGAFIFTAPLVFYYNLILATNDRMAHISFYLIRLP